MWDDFKPAFFFLAKFLAIYLVGNIIYGLYVESFDYRPDPLTEEVTFQTATALRLAGENAEASINPNGPTVFVTNADKIIISVFEGCNGINVMIIFIAFIVAFGGSVKTMTWFIPAGILLIHLFNLLRISLLYFAAIHYQQFFYYVHKYIFTAFLYLVVLALWAVWVFRFNTKKTVSEAK